MTTTTISARRVRPSTQGLIALARIALPIAVAWLLLPGPVARAEIWIELGVPWSGETLAITGSPADPGRVYALTARWGELRIARSTDGGASWTRADHGLPEALRAAAFAVAPSDGQTAYFADIFGGLFRTVDGGQRWDPVGDGAFDGGLLSLAIHPTNPAIVYLTSLEHLYRTTDGGVTWAALDKKFPADARAVERIVFDPSNPSTIYAWRDRTNGADGGQFFRSADAGASWTFLQNMDDVAELVVDPTDSNRLYVAQHVTIGPFEGGQIQTSADGGVTWTPLLGDDLASAGVYTDVDIDPDDPAVLYALNPSEGRLWRSVDAGANWSVVHAEPYGHGPTQLYAAPTAPATLFVAIGDTVPLGRNEAILRSADAGTTWTATASVGGGATTEIVIDPTDADRIYVRAGYTLPLYRSADGGASWSPIGAALAGSPRAHRSLYVAQSDSNVLYLQTDVHTYRSADAGATWAAVDGGLPALPFALAVDPNDADVVYAPVDGVYKTTDGGASWSQISGASFGAAVVSLAVDPSNPATLYAGAGAALFKSGDGGISWTTVLQDPDGCLFHPLIVAPGSPTRVYALCAGPAGALWLSTDAGATWSDAGVGTPGQYLTALAVHPGDPALAYVGFTDARLLFSSRGAIARTTDGGQTWRPYHAGLTAGDSVHALATAAGGAAEVLAGTAAGLYAQACTSTPLACDDGDPCTQDCQGALAGGCLNAPVVPSRCLAATQSQLQLKYNPGDASKNQLKWRWGAGEAFAQGDLGDPTAATDYALCVYDDDFTTFAAGVDGGGTCGTGACWAAMSDKGYKYKNKNGGADAITGVVFKGGAAGKTSALVKAKGASLPAAGLPLGGDVRVALYRSDGDLCLQSHFFGSVGSPHLLANRSTILKARRK